MSIYEKFFDEQVHLSPIINDYLQLKKYKSLRKKLTNLISPEYIKKTQKFYQKYEKILKEKKVKNIYDKVLEYEVKTNLEGYKYKLEVFPLDQMNNIVSAYIELLNGTGQYIFEKEEDYRDFMIRNRDFSIYCCQIISNMYTGITRKMVLPKPIVKMVIHDIESIMDNKDYINPKVPKKIKKEWDENVEEYVLMPIRNILLFLKTKYMKAARNTLGYSSLPDGKNIYKYLVKSLTTNSSLTIKQIHDLGLKEISRIYSEMKLVMQRMNYKKDFKHFVKHITTLKYNKFKNADEVMNHYKNTRDYLWKYIMPEFFDIKIKRTYDIKRIPKAIEKSAPTAYYLGGSLDGKRDGVFWLNLRNPKEMLKSDDLTLSKHEGIPGHHFQITLTNENKKIPMFIKVADYLGYIEGWALYAENIGEYEDDLEYFGKLNSEMLRAIRLVVDTGIHYYKWSHKRCFDLFKKYTTMTDGEINTEIYRYVADPGQALAYKIGELTILKLRNEYLKKNNDIKKFHRLVLEDGPLPLDILIDKIKKSK